MKEKEILQPTDNQVQPVLLTGLFENNVDAENAYQYLLKLGYKTEEISLIMSEDTRSKYFPDTVQSQELATDAIRETENGAAIGASIGLTLGTILGVAMAVTSNLVIPGMGFLIAGPLIAGLAGAGTGVVSGGIIGALLGVGFGADRAELYQNSINQGQIFLGVHPLEKDIIGIKESWRLIGGKEIWM
jgi:hypothetical protein